MYVRAEIEEGVWENALLVPQKSVARDLRNLPQVFVLTKRPQSRDETGAAVLGEHEYYVEARSIGIDREHGNRWLVADGLAPGELIVVDGLVHVRQGMVVSGRETVPAMTARDSDGTPGRVRR
jgi:membrane fusion protein (multidrug efflux system)